MTDDLDRAQLSDDMQLFTSRVRAETDLEFSAEAEVLARATMRQLREQISSGQAEQLTAGLPPELVGELTGRTGSHAASLDKTTFIDQVSGDVHATDFEVVERQVHAVLAVLRSWAFDGQLEQTLPKPLADMFA